MDFYILLPKLGNSTSMMLTNPTNMNVAVTVRV
jgi:hypothetical protein